MFSFKKKERFALSEISKNFQFLELFLLFDNKRENICFIKKKKEFFTKKKNFF
jgi:hypothetical protein